MKHMTDDPNRPSCPDCGKPMQRRGGNHYYCGTCRRGAGDLADPEACDSLPPTLRPPVVNCRFRQCATCIYQGQCHELERAGLPLLGEWVGIVAVQGVMVEV